MRAIREELREIGLFILWDNVSTGNHALVQPTGDIWGGRKMANFY